MPSKPSSAIFFCRGQRGRLYGVNPENALERTNRKFISRFNHIEKRAAELNRTLKEMSLAEMDELWNEAKSKETN